MADAGGPRHEESDQRSKICGSELAFWYPVSEDFSSSLWRNENQKIKLRASPKK
jgi:hypothetical protein